MNGKGLQLMVRCHYIDKCQDLRGGGGGGGARGGGRLGNAMFDTNYRSQRSKCFTIVILR